MRLAFMGTPDFAVPTLEALVAGGHEVVRVYAQPPARAGRGKALRPSPVQARAEALGLAVETPSRFREAEAGFAALGLDAAVVVAYGKILRPAALEAPRLGCFNLHASKLPRWRGAAPIQRAIMAGDAETAACVMRMDAGLDTGPVLACETVPIGPEETAGTLHDRLAALGGPLMLRALAALQAGTAVAAPQPEEGVTYAAKIEKAEARIDWSRDAAALSAHVRGLSPFPGAWFELAGERIKLLMALPEAAPDAAQVAPGTVLDDRLLVATGQGGLRLTRLQRAGRGPLAAADFLRGTEIPAGTRLG
ncbi:methionyl-tRNA formyltransferase [Paralimibaculum aggregatum]|uniref:Methionyl-tRNA formyltransferase n=1 Tax=Paralimibaculum aggregatum TaxID=3036245 RepID=A0ABQ6LFG5_9RHOB|nr:methionyl-tRNA formyltransferase [Limibaculum sp. NKW23]GMG80975.1 methionyl-tRNA formyltransferase [Limibaculum sp. NKW23]